MYDPLECTADEMPQTQTIGSYFTAVESIFMCTRTHKTKDTHTNGIYSGASITCQSMMPLDLHAQHC